MRHYALLVLGAAASLAACKDALTAHADVVAKAGSQELSVERLATLMGNSQAPLRKDVARTIADVWVDYQLLAQAAAKNDSLKDPKLVDDAMWSAITGAKIRKFYGNVSKSWTSGDSTQDPQLYETGDVLAARHILISVKQDMSPVQAEQARQKAESLRKVVTPANFSEIARKNSQDPGSAERGGDLGFFPQGQMVAEFEKAVKAIKPGSIGPVIRSQFGYHIIYRPTYAEVKTQFTPIARQRGLQRAESTYMAKAEEGARIDIKKNAISTVRAIALNVDEHKKDNTVIASTKYGDFTAAHMARWIASVPQSAQLRAQIGTAPDTLMPNFIKNVLRNDIVAKQADSAKITLDSSETLEMRKAFATTVTNAWAGLGVMPSSLNDSAKTDADRARVASGRVEKYFDQLMQQKVGFVDVPPPLELALRTKYESSINDAGIERAIEKAQRVRAASDSARTANQPQSSIPLPGADSGAPPSMGGAGKAPAAPAPAAPAPAAPAPAKKP